MRVLHIAPFYEPAWAYGGMARAASGLCRALAGLGLEVTVLTPRLDRTHATEERLGGVRVRRLDGPAFLQRRLLPWCAGLAREVAEAARACDVAHVHGHRSPFAAVAAGVLRRLGVRYAFQAHGTFPHHGQHRALKLAWDRVVGQDVVAGAALALAVSGAERADLPLPSRVVGNGVRLRGCAEPPARERGRLLFVGSDAPQKEGRLLLPLLDALPETRVDLAGRFSARFRRGFARLRARVLFLGVLDEPALAHAYARAGLVVHPAVGEAFGLVPFEAALCGAPAVVAGGHGCGEWFGRAGGCVVPPDDPAALIAAVRERLADPGLGAGEARAVAAFTRVELTWERCAGLVADAYRELVPVAA